MTGKLIAFEGLDGSGKTTVARLVADRLRSTGIQVVLTREPGGTAIGEQIRTLVLDSDHSIDPVTELLLMCADRAEHVRTIILPSLERNDVVITDRYTGSTRAYQGYGLHIDRGTIESPSRSRLADWNLTSTFSSISIPKLPSAGDQVTPAISMHLIFGILRYDAGFGMVSCILRETQPTGGPLTQL